MSVERRRERIEPAHPQLSIARPCELVSISRSRLYDRPAGETSLNLELMRLIDAQFLETPWYGARQMARHLRREGHVVGRKRGRRLMAKMGGDSQGSIGVADGKLAEGGRRSISAHGRRFRTPRTRSTPIGRGIWRSTGPTRSGART